MTSATPVQPSGALSGKKIVPRALRALGPIFCPPVHPRACTGVTEIAIPSLACSPRVHSSAKTRPEGAKRPRAGFLHESAPEGCTRGADVCLSPSRALSEGLGTFFRRKFLKIGIIFFLRFCDSAGFITILHDFLAIFGDFAGFRTILIFSLLGAVRGQGAGKIAEKMTRRPFWGSLGPF